MDRRQFLLASGAALAATRSELAVAARPRTLALATADTESRIAIVDPSTARVLGSIATVAGPRSIEQVAASTAIVAHTAHGAVTIVHDLDE